MVCVANFYNFIKLKLLICPDFFSLKMEMENMKKIIALAIVAISMVSASFALDFSIGARGIAGMNLDPAESVNDATNKVEKDAVYDFGFGVNANFALLGSLGLQGEANFITSKGKFNDLTNNKTTEYDTILMDMPVMLWLNLDLWKFTLGFGAGPNFSATLNEYSEIKAMSDRFKVGICAGVDGKFYLTNHLGLVASIRYIMDFQKTSVPIVIEGYEAGSYPSVEYTRKSLYGGLGLEWKFF